MKVIDVSNKWSRVIANNRGYIVEKSVTVCYIFKNKVSKIQKLFMTQTNSLNKIYSIYFRGFLRKFIRDLKKHNLTVVYWVIFNIKINIKTSKRKKTLLEIYDHYIRVDLP